ncbi:MAG TPA: tetratricopeptide repeat protein [Bacteroidales bacterium]|nr:tetratricopeptide repeat protein [Bacteroidales bacterium]
MQKDKKIEIKYVTKQNAVVIGLICLMAGFTAGVLFTSYKLSLSNPSPEKKQSIDYSKKETVLKNELSENPGNVTAWTQLGHVYYDTDQYAKAIAAYEKSLKIVPGNANVLTDMGVMYRRNKQPGEAINSFDKAIAADPKHESARFNKGIVLMHDLNEQDKALAVWENLLSINPVFMSSKDQSLDELIKHYRDH